jgi:hypothetical protein
MPQFSKIPFFYVVYSGCFNSARYLDVNDDKIDQELI